MRNLILSALILGSALQAALGEQDGNWTFTVSNNQATITSYADFIAPAGSLTVPSSLFSSISNTWLTVVAIGQNAFSYSIITSVTIPNGVTSIGNGAFSYCTRLTSIFIPNSVTSIGEGAFQGCTSLASVSIPNSVTSIGSGAFTNSGLGSVFISPTLNSSQISQAGFPSTAVFYVGSVGAPASMATQAQLALTQADLATTQTQLATTQAELANTKVQLENLANNDAFVTAVANKIKATSGNYGIATQSGLSSAITTAVEPLATKTELTSSLAQSRTDGINSVLSNPNLWTLYTTSQIQNMAVGDLVLTRQVSGGFVLNYDIEQSTDLQTWTPYQALSLPLTGLPTDKAFVRIKAKQ